MVETVYRKYPVMTIAGEVFFNAINSFALQLQLVGVSLLYTAEAWKICQKDRSYTKKGVVPGFCEKTHCFRVEFVLV
jgi:hypothetical protein